jgi:hypothetical protein
VECQRSVAFFQTDLARLPMRMVASGPCNVGQPLSLSLRIASAQSDLAGIAASFSS